MQLWQVTAVSERLGEDGSRQSQSLSNKFSFWSSNSFDQDHSLPGLRLLGAACVFGGFRTRAAQVQKAEACFQAEALLGAGSGAAVVVGGGRGGGVGGGWSVVKIPLCTFCTVTCSPGEGQ